MTHKSADQLVFPQKKMSVKHAWTSAYWVLQVRKPVFTSLESYSSVLRARDDLLSSNTAGWEMSRDRPRLGRSSWTARRFGPIWPRARPLPDVPLMKWQQPNAPYLSSAICICSGTQRKWGRGMNTEEGRETLCPPSTCHVCVRVRVRVNACVRVCVCVVAPSLFLAQREI